MVACATDTLVRLGARFFRRAAPRTITGPILAGS
jgi:hypothetical protein